MNYADPVSIHTLVSAALEIIHQLSKQQGKQTWMHDKILEGIRKEKRSEVEGMIKAPQNFFKHSGKDPDKTIKFYYKVTDHFLWDACVSYRILTNEDVPIFRLYEMWFYIAYPDVITDEVKKTMIKNLHTINPQNRKEFLEEMLPIILNESI